MSQIKRQLRSQKKPVIFAHPQQHKNRCLLAHQCRMSASGCTFVRGGVMKMPGYDDGPRRSRKGASS
ncbi:hypothetical protein [Saccharibacter floricola]|uniref:hypothetical protein n=1 Tax=Saccharibacter floricola TaxID=231053 RepID=UPI00036A2C1C|nr:hypothetical protein [Saccharibacter floricola]